MRNVVCANASEVRPACASRRRVAGVSGCPGCETGIRRGPPPVAHGALRRGPLVPYAAMLMAPLVEPRQAFAQSFGSPRALVGMVHVGALPGSPAAHHAVEKLVQDAVAEARAYRDAGFTAIAIENMHDRPYLKGGVGPEIAAAMAVIGAEVKRDTGLPLGV